MVSSCHSLRLFVGLLHLHSALTEFDCFENACLLSIDHRNLNLQFRRPSRFWTKNQFSGKPAAGQEDQRQQTHWPYLRLLLDDSSIFDLADLDQWLSYRHHYQDCQRCYPPSSDCFHQIGHHQHHQDLSARSALSASLPAESAALSSSPASSSSIALSSPSTTLENAIEN